MIEKELKGPKGEFCGGVCPYCGVAIQAKTCLCARCNVAFDMDPDVLRKIAGAKEAALKRAQNVEGDADARVQA